MDHDHGSGAAAGRESCPAVALPAPGPHGPGAHAGHPAHGADHKGHVGRLADHTGHELLFRNRFWICLALTIPVLLYSPMIQDWSGSSAPAFLGSQWIAPLVAAFVFGMGGIPFIQIWRIRL